MMCWEFLGPSKESQTEFDLTFSFFFLKVLIFLVVRALIPFQHFSFTEKKIIV